jgi:MoaA/NifB/PqqE/SkfB family radical SAM enzyme
VTLKVQTNGLLCERNWYKLGAAQDRVKYLTITFDAACAETYEILRRGGTWKELVAAMKFLSNKKRDTGMTFNTRMVVQQQNYQEIESFYQMCQQFDVDLVEYSRVTNWGTWSQTEFQFHDVFNSKHPEFKTAQLEIAKVKQLSGTWFAGL